MHYSRRGEGREGGREGGRNWQPAITAYTEASPKNTTVLGKTSQPPKPDRLGDKI